MPPYDGSMTEAVLKKDCRAASRPASFLCDHAGNAACRPAMAPWGWRPALFETHIAYDIGAAHVTRALAAAFGAPAMLGVFSRLLIDLNRGPDDPTLVMQLSDGSIIPGNRGIDGEELARRIARFPCALSPRHRRRDRAAGRATPSLISLHSFTPAWKGAPRPGRSACCGTRTAGWPSADGAAGARPASSWATMSLIPARWKATRSTVMAQKPGCRMC